ncbi:hypothetical protein J7337_003204 [Fusarium musae]|uniref:Uncharacterized protein n=1 Tax=Fusarium musae TaxID=1042133 RepID=A0A9P8DQL8_9HYPO|nr:hypothetical protein J7337_003204 [Fusarium musae]KAG9506223.1 hypothetical protein J7337_003204 [Fusarium musae]
MQERAFADNTIQALRAHQVYLKLLLINHIIYLTKLFEEALPLPPDTNVVAINAHLGREPGPAVDTEYFDFDDYRACLAVSKSWKAKFGMKGAMA